MGVGQFQRIRRDDGGDGLVLFQGHDRHTLTIAGGLCSDLRRADQDEIYGSQTSKVRLLTFM